MTTAVFEAVEVGSVRLPGAAAVVEGYALLSRPAGTPRALLRADGEVVLVDLAAAFEGAPAQLARVPDPWPQWRGTTGSASDDSGLIVLAGQRSVLALEADGRVRWEYRHGCWGDGPHPDAGAGPCPGLSHGSCLVSPDGTLVWAHVLPDLAPDDPDWHELWLLLDAADGRELARARIEGGSAGSHHLLRHDGRSAVLGTGQGQDGSPAYLGDWDGLALRVHEIGDGFRVPTAVHPGGGAFLSTPHSGGPLQLHSASDGRVLMDRDPGDLPSDAPAGLDWDYVAGFLDGHTVVAGAYDVHGDREGALHWLLDALTLRPLGRVRYPEPVDGYPVALGDGTWLTLAPDTGGPTGTELRRWARRRDPNERA